MSSMTRRFLLAVAVLGLVTGPEGRARADIVTFDFEGLAATSPPPLGALTSLALTNSGLTLTLTRENAARTVALLKPAGIRVTRLASGLPVGGDLEYADEVTLSQALEGRREI